MLEDTIESSPTNTLNSSIRAKREHRKTKRRRITLEKSVPLHLLYLDSEDLNDLNASTSRIKKSNCDRFKAESLMACADRCDEVKQFRQPPPDLGGTQGFQTCDRLLESQAPWCEPNMTTTEHDMTFMSCVSVQPTETECMWIEQPFEEDMSANFIVGSHNTADISTAQKAKSIVETILEDFCTSPLSTDTESNKLLELDAMPFFRFRRKKIRTYELRYRQATKNLPQTTAGHNVNETSCFEEDVDNESITDTCSELSVQEDMPQVHQTVEPLELNTSHKIHSNLLNLSQFFTQNQLDSDESTSIIQGDDAIEDVSLNVIKDIIKEILTLRTKYSISYGLTMNADAVDFYGFALDERKISPKNEAVENQESNLVASESESLISKNPAPAVEKNLKALLSDDHTVFHEDAWQHDADFFTNFQTQAHCKTIQINAENTSNLVRDETSTKQRRKSESMLPLSKPSWKNETTQNTQSQIAVEDILQLFENPRCNNSNQQIAVQNFDFDDMQLSEWPLLDNVIQKPCTSAAINRTKEFIFKIPQNTRNEGNNAKNLIIPKELENETESASIPFLEFSLESIINRNQLSGPCGNQQKTIQQSTKVSKADEIDFGDKSHQSFFGFQTASRKNINISEEARKKAENILAQLPDLPEDNFEENCELPCSQTNTRKFSSNTEEGLKDNESIKVNDCSIGIQAVSNKTITTCAEAKNNAENIFAQLLDFPDDDFDIVAQNYEPKNSENNSKRSETGNERNENEMIEFVGFQTASKKHINITEEAQKKAESIFIQLPEISVDGIAMDNQISDHDNKHRETTHQVAPKASIAEVASDVEAANIFEQGLDICEVATKQADTKSFIGFQTASRKSVHISDEAKKRAESILAQLPDLPEEDNFEKAEKNLKRFACPELKPGKSKMVVGEVFKERLYKAKNDEDIHKEVSACFIGFQTASKKTINISEDAKKKAESILDQLPDLPAVEVESIKNKFKNSSAYHINSPQISRTGQTILISNRAELLDVPKDHSSAFVGFHTASRKAINISDEARKKCENIFATLPDLSLEIGANNCEDLADIPLSEWIPSGGSPKPKNQSKPENTIKRKFQNIEITEIAKQPTKIIRRSNTTIDSSAVLAPTKEVHQNSNRKVTNSSVIVRKNLLSLTKRRKQKLQSIDFENNETPVKLQQRVMPQNTPNTPYTGVFCEQLPTTGASTPRQIPSSTTPLRCAAMLGDNLESDFKRINWGENADECPAATTEFLTPSRANNSANENSLKSLPSPQERIENLSMCGDPPPLPQLMNSNSRSRSLGLSRCRRSFISKK